MSEIDDLQREINHLAYTTFKERCEGYSAERLKEFSIPLIPRITQKCRDYGLVILGQETDTWYGKGWYENEDKNDDLYGLYKEFNLYDFIHAQESEVERICQVCRYDRHVDFIFNTEDGARKQGIWGYIRKICREVLGEPKSRKNNSPKIDPKKDIPFCLLDLFCVETVKYGEPSSEQGGRPSQDKDLAEEVNKMQGDLIYQILELIKPKAILATTSYKNDGFLKQYALGDPAAKVTAVGKSGHFSIDEIALMDVGQGALKGTKVIRTYHPNYFYGGNIPGKERKVIEKKKRAPYQKLISEKLARCLWP
jgi:hypothetical protein